MNTRYVMAITAVLALLLEAVAVYRAVELREQVQTTLDAARIADGATETLKRLGSARQKLRETAELIDRIERIQARSPDLIEPEPQTLKEWQVKWEAERRK